ncbi:MAG: hypothetical protein F6J92_04955 [Symploca sp. SIO1A3]|nr:hypothetical protein [Symploca sp. SIO1A3]
MEQLLSPNKVCVIFTQTLFFCPKSKTISKGIKQSAHLPVRATHSVAGDIRREFTSASSGSNNGDIVNIEYKPNITINSSADPQAIINALESRDEQFLDLIERVTGRRTRTEFA